MPAVPPRRAPPRPTRGAGLLERSLAALRRRAALALIPAPTPGAAILDIGCGAWPTLLLETRFDRKVGLDPLAGSIPGIPPEIESASVRFAGPVTLPFPDSAFACVTSLAVLEHLDPGSLPSLASEIRRVLAPGSRVVITTPHAVADPLLHALARLGLASREEIEEHQNLFRRRDLRALLLAGGFPEAGIRVGSFLLGLNIVALADK